MDIASLVRDFGIPVALLAAAVAALWRAWRVEHRLRERDREDRLAKLIEREAELYTLYRQLALRELTALANNRQSELKV
ncbi:hypothetical protein GF359_06405 [candidate division WOR-3 bacterium]|uniref:Uncharacterized protein n=1 Tax=candidate division WOR-3 bacterium TaxID=2052148 RepID=A0A9D5QE97_UNCW3|nr:hypothetical protein [candidate division WOR-3 bacterium]MBD3364830.1 hypothetical protein [candidate division WOR-3 bacterium]